jgi:6-phosphofructokinase 1
VRSAVRYSYRSIIIVMAEGVKKVCGRPQLAEELRRLIEQDREIQDLLGRPLETRVNIIGYIARGGSPSARDNLIASLLGCQAADLALSDEPREPTMVGLKGEELCLVPMSQVIERSPRLVSADSTLWKTARSLLISRDQSF